MPATENARTGRRGEKTFSLLCSKAGLICNSAQEDDAGWDFFVQFHLDQTFLGPADMRPPALSAFFQIKTSKEEKSAISIKLSNAERMVTESRPFFFAFGLADQKNSRISFRTGHIGANAIGHIVQALRESSARSKKKQRSTVAIPYSVLDIDIINDALDISNVIRKYSAEGIEKYIQNKIRVFKTVGFKENAYTGRFSLEGDHSTDDLISLMIGEKDALDVKDLVIIEKRFDIETVIERSSSATIKISASLKKFCTVLFDDESNGVSCEFTCEFWAPFISDTLHESFRVRVNHDYFAFSVGRLGGFTNWVFKPKWDEFKTWSEMREIAALVTLISSGFCNIKCYLDDVQFAGGDLKSKKRSTNLFRDFIPARNTIDYLCKDPANRSKIEFSLNEFKLFLKEHKLAYHALGSKRSSITIGTTVSSPPLNKPRKTHFILPLIFQCGQKLATAPIIAEGDAVVSGKKMEMTPSRLYVGPLNKFADRSGSMLFLKSYAKDFAERGSDDDFLVVEQDIISKEKADTHLLALK